MKAFKVERFALINAQQISSESLHVYMSAGRMTTCAQFWFNAQQNFL